MKLLFLFLFSIAAFAQSFNPDTIVYRDNTIAGRITDISDSKVRIEHSDKIRVASIPQITKITVGKLGLVYYSGFVVDVDDIQDYLFNRTERLNVDKSIDEKRFSPPQINENLFDTVYVESEIRMQRMSKKHRGSFGVLLIPYYSGKIYSITEYTGYPPVYSSSLITTQYLISSSIMNEINTEAQLSYFLNDRMCLTFDATYTAAHYENRSENRQSTYSSGTLIKNDLTLLDLNLGIKYYFDNLIADQVSAYLIAGMGKQFAFAEKKDEALFQNPQPGGYTYMDNRDEFIEDSNSPFHFNLGFGAEYFFNASLSLTSNIRLIYSTIDAEYDSRRISDYDTFTNTIDYKKSDFATRIGLGLNFYF